MVLTKQLFSGVSLPRYGPYVWGDQVVDHRSEGRRDERQARDERVGAFGYRSEVKVMGR